MKHLFANSGDSSKKILTLLLVLTLLFTLTLPAFAAENEQVTATTALNVRSGPGTGYSIIGDLKTGQTVSRVGRSGNWSKIVLNGIECYAFSSYLTVRSGGGGGSVPGNVQATGNVNVRSGPGTKYRKVGALKKSDIVIKVGTSGSWTIINWNSGAAYVSSRYLKPVDTVVPAPEESYYVTQNTTMRAGGGNNYSAVANLWYGDVVTLTAQQLSGWVQVKHNGRSGYVQWAYLSKDLPSAASGIAYATSQQEVQSGAGSDFSRLGYLQAGEGVERTGLIGSWTRIRYNGRDGYVRTSAIIVLTGSAVSEFTNAEQWMYAASERVYVYSIPDSNSDYRYGYLERNERVLQTAYNSIWTRVYAGARIGYIATGSLSRYDGGSTTGTGSILIYIKRNGAYVDSGVYGKYSANGSTIMIPLNTLLTDLGYANGFNFVSNNGIGLTKLATAPVAACDIVLYPDSKTITTTNGSTTKITTLEAAPEMINGVLYVPVNMIERSMGTVVSKNSIGAITIG